MSILAEPRRKRKMCIDPQNLTWKNDTNKFGHKMLQNMGWSEGQGLGINNQGMTENLKLKANFTQKGIGATANDYDKTWVQHHDEFSFLLEKLNAKKAKQSDTKEEESDDSEEEKELATVKKAKEEGDSKSLVEKSKATKTRIHYKFTKMKDLSRYSQKDKAAVIGVGLKSKAKEDETSKETIKNFEEPATVKNSVVSIGDYFASKMAKFYAKKNGVSEMVETVEEKIEAVEEENEVDAEEEERKLRKAEKKALKRAKREAEAKVQAEEAVMEEENENDGEAEEKRRRKAERKERRRKEREAAALDQEEQ